MASESTLRRVDIDGVPAPTRGFALRASGAAADRLLPVRDGVFAVRGPAS